MDRIKIAALTVGSQCNLPLIVKSVMAKETKAGKPYLMFELYDGAESLIGNYWDWASGVIPPVNSILNVMGKVDSWMGKKQINIKALTTSNEFAIADFMPASEYDLGDTYKDAYALLDEVNNDTLRDIALGLLEDDQSRWIVAPGATTVHHAYVGGTLVHSLSVARIAKAVAQQIPGANVDLCTVGGFLHDIGKLYSYDMNGIAIEMTDMAKLMEHTFLGARRIDDWCGQNLHLEPKTAAVVEMLLHIVLAHHGSPEFGAAVRPLCLEASIVHHADSVDATAEILRDASKKAEGTWTEKIYWAGNRPHLSMGYIQDTLENTEE